MSFPFYPSWCLFVISHQYEDDFSYTCSNCSLFTLSGCTAYWYWYNIRKGILA